MSEEKKENPNQDKEAHLISLMSNIEGDMIEALLKNNGIPVLKKYKEAGGYLKIYSGFAKFGVDIYVPSKLLEKAKDIIEGMF